MCARSLAQRKSLGVASEEAAASSASQLQTTSLNAIGNLLPQSTLITDVVTLLSQESNVSQLSSFAVPRSNASSADPHFPAAGCLMAHQAQQLSSRRQREHELRRQAQEKAQRQAAIKAEMEQQWLEVSSSTQHHLSPRCSLLQPTDIDWLPLVLPTSPLSNARPSTK